MDRDALRDKLRGEVHRIDAAPLLPHHRRGALVMVAPDRDLLEIAVGVAANDTEAVSALIADGTLTRPTLAQVASWIVETERRFQFVIVQPFVIAQALVD